MAPVQTPLSDGKRAMAEYIQATLSWAIRHTSISWEISIVSDSRGLLPFWRQVLTIYTFTLPSQLVTGSYELFNDIESNNIFQLKMKLYKKYHNHLSRSLNETNVWLSVREVSIFRYTSLYGWLSIIKLLNQIHIFVKLTKTYLKLFLHLPFLFFNKKQQHQGRQEERALKEQRTLN